MDRNISIDIAKGIAIICVIIGHCPLVSPYTSTFIYSFHMPLFFILSGYFYHEKNISQSLYKDFKRLLIPYLVFAFIHAAKFTFTDFYKGNYSHCLYNWLVAVWGSGGNHSSSFLFGSITGAGIIWFLPAMFWCKNLYNVCYKYINNKCNRYLLVCLISISATLVSNYLINMPFGILTGASAMIFYTIGNIAKNMKINYIFVVILFVAWGADMKFGGISMVDCHYGFFPLDIIGACGGTFFICLISIILSKVRWLSKFLTWAGRASMVIFCMHYVAQIIDINTRLGINQWFVWLLIDFIIILSLSYICTRISITRKLFQIN